MIYRIEKEDFRLDLELDKWCDDNGEINADLTIRVGCEGFYGSTTVDFVAEDFQIFLKEMQKLQDTLTGRAELKEPYDREPFLTFEGDGRGHIHVNGCIESRRSDWTQMLTFENEIDQTFLPMKCVDKEELE